MFERSLEEAGVSCRLIEFSSATSLKRCLQRGIGVSICPEIGIAEELRRGDLHRLATSGLVVETPVLMIRHIDKWCSSLLRRFMELTRESIC